jgi:hypothetical protein
VKRSAPVPDLDHQALIVSRWTPVIRSVESNRIALTSNLMTWVWRASGKRFHGTSPEATVCSLVDKGVPPVN